MPAKSIYKSTVSVSFCRVEGVSDTIKIDALKIDAFPFCSAEEAAMALVMDKVIEEILKYRKYKVWRCLDDNSLLAWRRRMETLPPATIRKPRGFFLWR